MSAEGKVVGRGTHTYEGMKHARCWRIEAAGDRARGATLYLNSGALLARRTHRPMRRRHDRRRRQAGRRRHARSQSRWSRDADFAKLRAAGIEVHEGLCEPEARKLNEAFAKYIRHKTPFVTLKTAMTLDGKIAPPPGDGVPPGTMGSMASSGGWITSEVARAHVHEMRHANDAIMVGVGTIIADDPLLTDRTGLPRRRPLLRVILDSRLRLPLDSRVVKTAQRRRHRLLLLRRGTQAARTGSRAASWWSRCRCVSRLEDGTIPFPRRPPASMAVPIWSG